MLSSTFPFHVVSLIMEVCGKGNYNSVVKQVKVYKGFYCKLEVFSGIGRYFSHVIFSQVTDIRIRRSKPKGRVHKTSSSS